MRPAQKAPENVPIAGNDPVGIPDFNEAGAKSAGKHGRREHRPQFPFRTSMRPAQKAPENELVDFSAPGQVYRLQ